MLVESELDTNIFRNYTNMGLTDAKLRALKPKGHPYKIADGEGLYIFVQTRSSKHPQRDKFQRNPAWRNWGDDEPRAKNIAVSV
jgi:hypothetical protein